MNKEVFPFVCVSESDLLYNDTLEKVIEHFYRELKTYLKWIKGYKYWRMEPKLNYTRNFETNKEFFRIYSRLFALEDEHKNDERIKEATLDGAKESLEPQIQEIKLKCLKGG